MAPTARIRLFGQLDLHLAGEGLPPLESARAESLLGYLLLHRDAATLRQRLAFLLWPDSTEAQARTNLRHVLHTLRRRLPDADQYLEITQRALRWRPGASCWLDVEAFDQLLTADVADAAGRRSALREAVAIYTGDLLEGCDDEWLLAERERLRLRLLAALDELAGLCEAAGDLTEAVTHAERLLRGDPLRESTYRQLMRLHDARGDRARALRIYHVASSVLEQELGVEPSPASQAAYEALLPHEPGGGPSGAARVNGPTLVGRAAERTRLVAAWRSVVAGQARLALVTGEAGIGKTRLVDDFRAWCAHRGATTVEGRSYAAEGTLAYGLVVSWLRSPPVRARLERLDRARLTEIARLLPELLVEMPGLQRPEPLPDSDQRRLLFDAVAQAILTTGRPLLLVADDLQWADRQTLQFLHYLLRIDPRAPLLVVGTARSEDVDSGSRLSDLLAGLQVLDRVTEIELARLNRQETGLLAAQLAGSGLVSTDVDRLWNETEGNPLFVVEALRGGWQSSGEITPRVQAVIDSRLAQLSEPARHLAGVAACIGRDFTLELLAHASDTPQDSFVRGLDELWRRRIVREQGSAGYDFSHEKIRAVAYGGVSPAHRHHHHLRIAQCLERLHHDDPGSVGAQIASHYANAGAPKEAASWYVRAAQAAQELHAVEEAVRLLYRAREVELTRSASRDRDEGELAVLTALPAPLVAVEGYASPRLSAAHERALELANALGTKLAPPLLRSLALANLTLGDFGRARRFGAQILATGERDGDDVLVVEGACVLGFAAFWEADFLTARGYLDVVVSRYRDDQRSTHLLRYGQDPKVVSLARLGNTLWFLGQPAAAVRARDAALALSDEIGHPFSRAAARVFAAMLALDMGQESAVRDNVAVLADLGLQARPIRLVADALGGYVDALDGRGPAGIARIDRALQDARRQEPAPGTQAMIGRVLLAACVAVDDVRAGLGAAGFLLDLGGAARPWAAEARRRHAAFSASRAGKNG